MSFDNTITVPEQVDMCGGGKGLEVYKRLSGIVSSSGSPALGNVILTTNYHEFKKRHYRSFASCSHCGQLISAGLKRLGLHCRRCGIDIHEKCQEDLEKPCVEVIIGQHHFRQKTYTRPTSCDYCSKFLTGMVRQGLKCSECGVNVHSKCQDSIDVHCEGTRLGRKKKSHSKRKLSTSNENLHVSETSPLLSQGSEDESDVSDFSKPFQTMSPKAGTSQHLSRPSISSLPSSPQPERRQYRSMSLDASAILSIHNELEKVTGIMYENVKKLSEREGNLNTLKDKSETLEEQSKIFEEKSKEIKETAKRSNTKLKIGIVVAISLVITILIAIIVFQAK